MSGDILREIEAALLSNSMGFRDEVFDAAHVEIQRLRGQMDRYANERNHYRAEKFRLERELAAALSSQERS